MATAASDSSSLRIQENYSDTETRPIWIYVDDSNIWIEAKKLAGKEKRFKTGEDHRVRIEIGRLAEVVAKKRPVAQGFLYGSEPPPVDTVWEKIKQKGWKVDPHPRSRVTGKEKKVDTQLVADVTEKAIITPVEERSTIVLITGDADAIPAIEKALKYEGWQVEVYMWKQAVSTELKKLAREKKNGVLSLFFLDDYLQQVTFTNKKFSVKGNEHLIPRIKKSGVVLTLQPNSFRSHIPYKWWLEKIDSIAQFPFQYYWAVGSENAEKSNDMVLYFRGDKKHEFDIVDFVQSVKEVNLDFVEKVQPYLEYEQSKKQIYQLATCGRFDYNEAMEHADEDSDSVYSNEKPDNPYKLVRYRHRRGNQQYSEACPYGYNCKYGSSCYYQHTQEEKEVFKTNVGKGKPFRKIKPCRHHPNCANKKEECQYAHGEEDAWCLICCSNQGHFTDNCTKK